MALLDETRRRGNEVDNDMERARKELAQLDRPEVEETSRRQVEDRRFYERKWERVAPILELFLKCFPMIREIDGDWRRDVFCGKEQVEPDTEQVMRGLYGLWISYSGMFRETAEYLGRHLPGKLDDALDRLIKFAREGDRILRTWEPPVLSKGYSFRAPPLSPQAAARFEDGDRTWVRMIRPF